MQTAANQNCEFEFDSFRRSEPVQPSEGYIDARRGGGPATDLAAAFSKPTDCRQRNNVAGIPGSVALSLSSRLKTNDTGSVLRAANGSDRRMPRS